MVSGKRQTSQEASPMTHRFAVPLATAGVVSVLAVAVPAASARDYNCSDFSSQRQAQKFFKKHGGPGKDPYRLDADHDGIACEALP
jgi:hypothetical protein